MLCPRRLQKRHAIDRVVALVHQGMTPAGVKVLHASFAEVFTKLANQEPITCAQSGIQYDALPCPNAAVIDVSCFRSHVLSNH